MTMSTFEAGILVAYAAIVSSAAPAPPEPMPQAPPHATATTTEPPAETGARRQTVTADHGKTKTDGAIGPGDRVAP
jgi:hypothetical protein